MADAQSMSSPMTSASADDADMEKLDLASSRAAREQHQKLVDWTKQQFQAIKNARAMTERQWYLNLAMYFGKQNVAILKPSTQGQGLSTKFYVPPAPYYRSRPVINRIRPTIRTELAQLTGNKPNASVVPASAEDRDMYAAMAGEQIWDSLFREHKLKAVIRKAMFWTLTCGNGFIKTYWDPNKGDQVPQTNPITGVPTGETAPQGDLCFTHETPFHILAPDLREEEIESQPFIIHAQVKSPDYVKMRFDKALDGTPINPNSSDAMDLMEENFLNLIGTQSLNKQQSVLVLEVWIKPGMIPLFKEGAFFTMVGDKIVQGFQGWPYKHAEYPIAKFDHILSGKFYSTSLIEDLIPLQKEYNRTRGQIIEAKNRMAKPQLIAPRGSVDASKITTEPGLVIQYTPGFDPPQPIPLASLPSYVIQEIDRILLDWNDISGQHEVTQGRVPPGITAATAISYLQERDESKLSHTYDSLEEGIEKIAKQTLSLVNQFWEDERVVKVTGPDGSFDAQAFRGSDIEHGMDIRVEAGSALPVSKAAKQALIMDLMKMGFIDPNKGLEVMDMGGINKIYEQIQTDQRQVQRENLRMSRVTEEVLKQYNDQNMQMMQQSVQEQQAAQQEALQGSIQGMQEPGLESQGMQQEQQPMLPGMSPEGVSPEASPEIGMQQPAAPVEPINPLKPWDGNEPPLIIPVNSWDDHKIHIQYHNNYRKGQAFESMPEFVKALFEAHVNQHIMALGIESETMNPRLAAGLPPDPMEEGSAGQESSPSLKAPGPEEQSPPGQAGQMMQGSM